MPPITKVELKRFFEEEPMEVFLLDGVVDAVDAWYLGQFGIQKGSPRYNYGFVCLLADTAQLYTVDLDPDETGTEGTAVIFREWDSSPRSTQPSEMFVGWVRPERRGELEQWLSEMRSHLAAALEPRQK